MLGGPKERRALITINQPVEEGGVVRSGAAQWTPALPRPPSLTSPAAVCAEQHDARHRGLNTAHAQRATSWTADARVQYKDHFAANPEKLISVLTLLDRENPTVISNELQINFSQEFNTGSMTGKCHDCLALR